MCSMAAVWRMYGYQDYPTPEPPVCAFNVCSGAQLKDFIKRGEITELQINYNRPAALDALKYTNFLEKYNTPSKLPKYHAEIMASSGSAVVVSLRRIGARGARDVTRAPYWGPRGARCNLLLNTLR